MIRLMAAAPLLGLLVVTQPVSAAPPSNAKPLSEIIKALEDSGNVAYFKEIDWKDGAYWEIEYYRPDGSKVEVKIDPVSGQQRH